MIRSASIFLGILVLLFTACECPATRRMGYVQDVRRDYFADSIASVADRMIQFTFVVDEGWIDDNRQKNNCLKRDLALSKGLKTWVMADSVKVICTRNLPYSPAGTNLIGNPYVDLVLINDPAYTGKLRTLSFQSNWTVPNWKSSVPDTATLRFLFKLNTGAVITREQHIEFIQ
jgi:hypothetical protein